jgi:hypothetical protein
VILLDDVVEVFDLAHFNACLVVSTSPLIVIEPFVLNGAGPQDAQMLYSESGVRWRFERWQ